MMMERAIGKNRRCLAIGTWLILLLILFVGVWVLSAALNSEVRDYFSCLLAPGGGLSPSASEPWLAIFLNDLAHPSVNDLAGLSLVAMALTAVLLSRSRALMPYNYAAISALVVVLGLGVGPATPGIVSKFQITVVTCVSTVAAALVMAFLTQVSVWMRTLGALALAIAAAPFLDLALADRIWPNYVVPFADPAAADYLLQVPSFLTVVGLWVAAVLISIPALVGVFVASFFPRASTWHRRTYPPLLWVILGLLFWAITSIAVESLFADWTASGLAELQVDVKYVTSYLLLVVMIGFWGASARLKPWFFAFFALFFLTYRALPLAAKPTVVLPLAVALAVAVGLGYASGEVEPKYMGLFLIVGALAAAFALRAIGSQVGGVTIYPSLREFLDVLPFAVVLVACALWLKRDEQGEILTDEVSPGRGTSR